MEKLNLTEKRKTYLIDKEFQTKFILKFCALVVLGSMLTIEALYLLAMKSTTVSIINSRVVVRSTADFLLPILIQTVVIVTILVGLATIAVTLFVSHKIAGPLYRFRKVVETLSTGDFSSNFNIRDPDQLQTLAEAFNKMITNTRGQINMLKDNLLGLKNKLNSFTEREVSQEARNEFKKITEALDKIIQYFKS
ncbi:MAG: hypothetical protein A2166_05460 [Omnitrophica WOR_2 bacterium RBG_13_41_10]|nr:MAG: hypothetical protein A2166_05460 [Omnitrophica WOR_2 bacterium RBG_13_41_10]